MGGLKTAIFISIYLHLWTVKKHATLLAISGTTCQLARSPPPIIYIPHTHLLTGVLMTILTLHFTVEPSIEVTACIRQGLPRQPVLPGPSRMLAHTVLHSFSWQTCQVVPRVISLHIARSRFYLQFEVNCPPQR